MDRKTCYLGKNNIIYKMMDKLYPRMTERELPMFKVVGNLIKSQICLNLPNNNGKEKT